MKILVLETSSEKACILLVDDRKSIAHLPLHGGPELSKAIAQEVALLLKRHAFQPQKVAVGTGPGSFTGVRVGISLAKALAFGWQIPLIPFCSLKAFIPRSIPADLADAPETYAVLVDAKREGVYALLPKAEEPLLWPIEEASASLQKVSHIFSPHPADLQRKLSLSATWIEKAPDPECFTNGDLLDRKGVDPLQWNLFNPRG